MCVQIRKKAINQQRYEMKKLLGIPLDKIFTQTCSDTQLINEFHNKEDRVKKKRKTKAKLKTLMLLFKQKIKFLMSYKRLKMKL